VSAADFAFAARWVADDGLVIYPTDTLYGIAANPLSTRAVEALFALKGRDATAALPLIAASLADVERSCGELPPTARILARHFWPGPLSLILDAPASVAPAVHAGQGTVAVRVPNHPVARAFAEACGALITATSANRSGDPPVPAADDLAPALLNGAVIVIDAGRSPGGEPSTIVDARGDAPLLVRAGAIAWKRVLESLQG
jgi:L-threonylcarbamoyladenylate synthase